MGLVLSSNMSLVGKILKKRKSSQTRTPFASTAQAGAESVLLTREDLSAAVADAAQSSAALKVWIEPASARTKSQRLLTRSEIEKEDLFIIGRRGFGEGRYDYSNPGFQIRDHEPFTISKRHCSISITSEGVLVEDLRSRFGVIVNGQRLGVSRNNPSRVVLGRGEHDLVIGRRSSDNRFRLIVQ